MLNDLRAVHLGTGGEGEGEGRRGGEEGEREGRGMGRGGNRISLDRILRTHS